MTGKPVTGSQIQRIIEAVHDKDAGLATVLDELFHQAEVYGINVQRDESGWLVESTPDNELPGMWERADFTGGETDT